MLFNFKTCTCMQYSFRTKINISLGRCVSHVQIRCQLLREPNITLYSFGLCRYFFFSASFCILSVCFALCLFCLSVLLCACSVCVALCVFCLCCIVCILSACFALCVFCPSVLLYVYLVCILFCLSVSSSVWLDYLHCFVVCLLYHFVSILFPHRALLCLFCLSVSFCLYFPHISVLLCIFSSSGFFFFFCLKKKFAWLFHCWKKYCVYQMR